jgi:hypothetical protein
MAFHRRKHGDLRATRGFGKTNVFPEWQASEPETFMIGNRAFCVNDGPIGGSGNITVSSIG